MIKIFFRSRKDHTKLKAPVGGDILIELSWNNWDDFTYKTTLNTKLVTSAEVRDLDSLKILVEGENFTAKYLESLVERGWDGFFPIPNTNYISNPSQITFYEELIALTGFDNAFHAVETLRDASYLTRLSEDERALAMTLEQGFRSSLQRERGDKSSFHQGWKLFSDAAVTIDDVTFHFRDRDDVDHEVILKYSAGTNILPHDINLLIGPNGAGKSAFLLQLVEDWLQTPQSKAGGTFKNDPGFNRLIAVSYSPFERLRVDTSGLDMSAPEAYRYFGLRGRATNAARETLSLDHARQAAVRSLISCVADDRRFGAISAWSQKIITLHSVLRLAIDFDFVGLSIPATMSGETFTKGSPFAYDPVFTVPGSSPSANEKAFLRIDEATAPTLNSDALVQHTQPAEGVTLFKDGVPVAMSSGQRLFSYVVINILGAIRRNSLIVIDEPELFLHPSLEIGLITMLKSILETYSCKALIATHSALLTREVPRDCVHVFHPTDDGLQIRHPPFQTFGADVQRISSYVFGDNATTKPFERWVTSKSIQFGGSQKVRKRAIPCTCSLRGE